LPQGSPEIEDEGSFIDIIIIIERSQMPVKLLFTVVGFNGLVLVFVAGVVVVFFRPAQFGLMSSIFLGWLTGFVNLNSSEPQLPALLLLSFGFFIGFVARSNVWKLAIVLGMFVPLSQFLWLIASHQSDLLMADGVGSFVALIPAFGGMFLGKFVAKAQKTDRGTVQTSDEAAA
jgi:hypothetical protein